MATATREQYIEDAKKKLDEWNAQLDGLEDRIAKAREAGRAELEPELRRVRELHASAQAKLDEWRQAGRDAARGVEQETRHFMDVLDRSIRYFRSQL